MADIGPAAEEASAVVQEPQEPQAKRVLYCGGELSSHFVPPAHTLQSFLIIPLQCVPFLQRCMPPFHPPFLTTFPPIKLSQPTNNIQPLPTPLSLSPVLRIRLYCQEMPRMARIHTPDPSIPDLQHRRHRPGNVSPGSHGTR